MPELPEVEAVCRKLRRQAIGATLADAHIERLRITEPQNPREVEARLRGFVIERIDRRGKNILIILSGGLTMRVHLRMTGNLYVIPDWRLREARSNAWFGLDDGRGLLFVRSADGLRQPAKLFLLDQRRIAGLGNIYAAEALFAARIHPRAAIGAAGRPKLKALHA